MEQTTIDTENKWFVLRAISGKEKKVKLLLESEIELSGWETIISQVLIPTEKVYKIKKRQKSYSGEKLFTRLYAVRNK